MGVPYVLVHFAFVIVGTSSDRLLFRFRMCSGYICCRERNGSSSAIDLKH